MNHLSVPACSALALLFLSACGGDAAPAPSTKARNSAGKEPPKEQLPAAPEAVLPQAPAKKPIAAPRLDIEAIQRLFGPEPKAPPSDNQVTPDKVALGRLLYHEQHLSKNGNLSCASCHDLASYGQDGKPTSPGTDRQNGDRNSPTVLNAFRQFAQFWDGRAATIEDQALKPVLNPVEHGVAGEQELVGMIRAEPDLVAGFAKAFPGESDPVTVANFQKAVGAFERQLATRSRFDDFLAGDGKALTNEEKLGLKHFVEVGCTECHTSRLVGGDQYQKAGKFQPFPSPDPGRGKVTNQESDQFVFKVPSLLNVEKTMPYFHDGKTATLAGAIDVMAAVQLGKKLTDEQRTSIEVFLKALTGPLPKAATSGA